MRLTTSRLRRTLSRSSGALIAWCGYVYRGTVTCSNTASVVRVPHSPKPCACHPPHLVERQASAPATRRVHPMKFIEPCLLARVVLGDQRGRTEGGAIAARWRGRPSLSQVADRGAMAWPAVTLRALEDRAQAAAAVDRGRHPGQGAGRVNRQRRRGRRCGVSDGPGPLVHGPGRRW